MPVTLSKAPIAVLDSACSANVSGSIWIQDYLARLTDAERSQFVTRTEKPTSFAFGRDIRISGYQLTLPEWSEGCLKLLSTAVIDENPADDQLPLLLSRPWQKARGLIIDHTTYEVVFPTSRETSPTDPTQVHLVGRRLRLIVLAAGHHGINLVPKDRVLPAYVASRVDQDALSKKEIRRLHAAYGHPAPNRLRQLLSVAGCTDAIVLQKVDIVSATCPVCLTHGRPDPRPRTCIPLSLDGSFNDWVAIDLSMFEGRWRVLVICLGTRFLMGRFLPRNDKSSESLIAVLEACWISIFGPMRHILSDAGGENISDAMV